MTKFYTIYLWVATISIALGHFRTDIPTSTRPGILEDFSTESDAKWMLTKRATRFNFEFARDLFLDESTMR